MKTIKRVLMYFRPYLGMFILSVVSLTLLTLLGLMRPKLTQIFIDKVVYGKDASLIPKIATALILIAVFRGIFRYVQGVLSEKVAMNSIADIRKDLFNHLMGLPYEYYDKARTGELMSRISGDVRSVKHLLGEGLLEFYDAILTFVVVFFLLLRLNWQLTLVSLASMPFLFYTTTSFASKIRPAYTKIREQMADMSTTIQENVTGVRVVKAFNNQEMEKTKFDKDNKGNFIKRLFAVNIRAKYIPIIHFFGGVSSVVIIWYGGYQVIIDNLSPGELVQCYSYIFSLIWPIRRLALLINFFQRADAAAQRVFEVLDVSPNIINTHNAHNLKAVRESISFNNVSFSYDESNVLSDINIHVEAGQTIGILGETGSGKSSLVSLICRFYDVNEGSITIDGLNVKDLNINSLRQQIGIVNQDIFLFSASIKENIAFGSCNASHEDIVEAAKIAQAHDFIMAMENGYDTLVGERGIGLSGGQKQRIAIARSLVRKPNILILDDATSSVDMETEFAIQRDIAKVLHNKTTFIIAHRISSIKDADMIYVFKQGKIIEQGTHNELLNKNGYYNSIFKDQFKEREILANFIKEGVE